MLISLNWLKDFVAIPKNLDPKDLAENLTLKTAEVEQVIDDKGKFEKMVVGQVTELLPHPNADKLKIAKTSIGRETVKIVCGGKNLREGMYVAVAKPGAKIRWHGEGGLVALEKAKIRGEESNGMICASSEIGIETAGEGHEDILNLSALKPAPGTPLSKIFGVDDVVFEFDNKSLTHRPDLWGHYGVAREIAALTDAKLKPYEPKVKIPKKGESVKVEIKDAKLCPRFCALIINDIKVQQSPEWLQKRLKTAGHGIHNNIVDVTNYVMAELGQPMHAFDKNLIKGGIIVRMAKDKEPLTALDGKERILGKDIGVVADHERAVSVAGIIGGQNSEINPKTTSIILEAANWHPAILRRASIKLGVRTEAVQRFEKSLDPRWTELAVKRAAEIILEICPGARIAGPMTDQCAINIQLYAKNAYSYKTKGSVSFRKKQKFVSTYPEKIGLSVSKTCSKIGVKIPSGKIKKILESLEFKVHAKDKDVFMVRIPSFRGTKDVKTEDDLIEEVARIYGYENIPTSLPMLPTKLPVENTERFKKHRTRELFSYGLGFDEVYNYSFYSREDLKKCLLADCDHAKLLNYLSEDQTHLRVSLIPNLLKNLRLNTKYFSRIKIYEIGRAYKEIKEYFPLEEKKIAGAILAKEKTDNIFYEAKGAVESFFEKFNIRHIQETPGVKNTPYAHPSKAVSYIDQNGRTIAKAFMLHPTVQKNHDLEKCTVSIFEINFTEALKLDQPVKSYKPLARFPGINIDISVVLNRTTESKTIEDEILKADKELIKEAKLFDIYEGGEIAKGKKALAYTITLQASNRTLTDEEMAKVQRRIFMNLEKLGGKIRGRD